MILPANSSSIQSAIAPGSGYYADLDVTSLKPIEKWEVPKEANMIVGFLAK